MSVRKAANRSEIIKSHTMTRNFILTGHINFAMFLVSTLLWNPMFLCMMNINENNDVQNDEEDKANVKVTRKIKGYLTSYLIKNGHKRLSPAVTGFLQWQRIKIMSRKEQKNITW